MTVRKRFVEPTEAEKQAEYLKALRKDVRTYTKVRADWIANVLDHGGSQEVAESCAPVKECDRILAEARAEIERLVKS